MKFVSFNKKYSGLLLLLLVWAAVVCFVFFFTLSQRASGSEKPLPIYRVFTEEKKLALTFNCAWEDNTTDAVLAVLQKHNAKCTFFAVGDFAKKYPNSIRKIYNAGHEIANHSLNHANPVHMKYDELSADIIECNKILKSITGADVTLYRAPSGSYNSKTVETVRSLGMHIIQWDVDSIDWKNPSPQKITQRLVSKAVPGSILLLHLGKENTLNALDDVINLLKAKGYSFCTVSELIYKTNYTVDSNGVQHPIR